MIIDDGDVFMQVFEKGWRWEGGDMKWRLEYKEEDEELDEEDDVRVMREFRRLCNSIWPWIQVKEDVGSKYEDKKLPILDLKVYVVELVNEYGVKYWVPRWSFYEKPMKSQYVLMKESAMGKKTKVTTLTQEVIRRLRNTSREAEDSEREEVMTKFAVKMWKSGYREYSRGQIHPYTFYRIGGFFLI